MKSDLDNRLYVGYTKDLNKRINDHNSKRVNSTKNRGELRLIYYEAFVAMEDAIRKEKYYKSCSGRKHIKAHLIESIKS